MNTGNIITDTKSIIRLTHKVDSRLEKLFMIVKDRTQMKFIITEGIRTAKRQEQLVKAGASKTMNSKHLVGRAVDVGILVNGQVRWDWPLYTKFAAEVKAVAEEILIPIQWGGDWKKFKDGPHFELRN